jgi:hypothetical protein
LPIDNSRPIKLFRIVLGLAFIGIGLGFATAPVWHTTATSPPGLHIFQLVFGSFITLIGSMVFALGIKPLRVFSYGALIITVTMFLAMFAAGLWALSVGIGGMFAG